MSNETRIKNINSQIINNEVKIKKLLAINLILKEQILRPKSEPKVPTKEERKVQSELDQLAHNTQLLNKLEELEEKLLSSDSLEDIFQPSSQF